MTLQERANELRERLRKDYNIKTPFQFELSVTQLTQGEHNKYLRQEIIYLVTGDKPALTKCSTSAVTTVLENSFKQISIF